MGTLTAGQLIAGRYELDHRIAVGGMGEVWEAADIRLGRSVAVKILRPELSGDEEFLYRFRIEARTVASLDHPGIAHVHDYGEHDDAVGRRTAYLVMELVRGEPLSALVARGPVGADETLRIVEQAAWALHAAHERGFVHRDVKPGNILVAADGRVKLTDFGIAKAANAVPMTRSGMVMGTAHYIAPEQATGGEAGPTGDVYSLGIVGYECLTGHRPFRGDSAVDVAAMQVRDAPPPLPATVPVNVRALIEAVLVKDPAQRYATGEEFARAVAAVRRGEAAPLPGSVGTGADPADRSDPAGAQAAPARRRRRWSKSDAEPPRHARARSTPPESPAVGQPAAPPPAASSTPPASLPPVSPPPVSPPPGEPFSPSPAPAPRAVRPYVEPVIGPPAPTWTPEPSPRPLGTPPTPLAPVDTPRPTPVPRAPHTPVPRPTGGLPPGRGAGPLARPLNVTPRSGVGRSFLLVLFVLLTVAAVVVGYLVFVRGVGGTGPNRPTSAGPAGSVTGREDVLDRWTAAGAPFAAMIIVADVRWTGRTGPPALRPGPDHPIGRTGPA